MREGEVVLTEGAIALAHLVVGQAPVPGVVHEPADAEHLLKVAQRLAVVAHRHVQAAQKVEHLNARRRVVLAEAIHGAAQEANRLGVGVSGACVLRCAHEVRRGPPRAVASLPMGGDALRNIHRGRSVHAHGLEPLRREAVVTNSPGPFDGLVQHLALQRVLERELPRRGVSRGRGEQEDVPTPQVVQDEDQLVGPARAVPIPVGLLPARAFVCAAQDVDAPDPEGVSDDRCLLEDRALQSAEPCDLGADDLAERAGNGRIDQPVGLDDPSRLTALERATLQLQSDDLLKLQRVAQRFLTADANEVFGQVIGRREE